MTHENQATSTMTTEDVWKEFSSRLRSYIRRQVRDDDTAEDILQEVFLRMHAHGATVRAEEKLAAWLYQVTRNAIVDHHRRGRSDRLAPLPPDAAERFAMPETDETEQRIQALLPCVRTMVEALPEPYREALLLTEYNGLTQKALADRLGLSFSGAKSRVQRAREKLRSLLLACCHLEFDHAGRVIDYDPHCSCCTACSTSAGSEGAERGPGGCSEGDESEEFRGRCGG
jgi:RNA polymerase sigma-70 factor, ECF subfamily